MSLRNAPRNLAWQSKAVLLLTLPATAVDLALKSQEWATRMPEVAIWVLGISMAFGLIAWQFRAATPGAAAAGAILTASLMASTLRIPYLPWRTALIPVLAVALLAYAATRVGREAKAKLGAAERSEGRNAAQIAANLGVAALVASGFAHSIASGDEWFTRAWSAHASVAAPPLFIASLAALAEAAADTVSSEIGQVFGRHPRMIVTLRRVPPGTNGAVSAAGTMAGAAAAGAIAFAGAWALGGGPTMLAASWAGAVFGIFFDSFLGAVFELRGWLNNDAVNFLSTAGAAAFALAALSFR